MTTINGKTYNSTDFENGGHKQVVTAGTGESLIRFLAALVDCIADAARARQTTSATSKNAALTGSQSWVLAEDISFAAGSYVTIARTSDPTATFYIAQVTGYVSGTKTLTVNVVESTGSGGPYTDWTISLAAKPASSSVLPVADSTAIVKGSADATKQVRMEVDGLTTGATRVVTVPDADGTLAYLASPAFTGTPTAPTASADTDTTQLATTAFVHANLGFKVGNFTRDTSTASGTQAVTGVGFQPRAVIFLANQSGTKEMSVGVDDGTTKGCVYQQTTAGNFGVNANAIVADESSGVNNYIGSISSLDSDGFTISWTKTGSPTGTLSVYYLALR